MGLQETSKHLQVSLSCMPLSELASFSYCTMASSAHKRTWLATASKFYIILLELHCLSQFLFLKTHQGISLGGLD